MKTQTQTRTFTDILSSVRQWETDHQPFDRTSRLPLFQYIIEEGAGGALVPISDSKIPPVYLQQHAHDQLIERLDYSRRTYNKLPAKLNILIVNYLIQNHYNKDVLLRVQDGNQARALLSGNFEPFDNIELLTILEPYCKDAQVRWEFKDEMTMHISLTFPKTQEEIKVGDIVQRGIHISNSEVGVRSVTIAGYVYRLKCSNGSIGGDGSGFYRFRHIGDSDRIRDHVHNAIEQTFLESTKVIAQFKASLDKAISNPYTYMENIAKDKNNDMTQEQYKASLNAFLEEPEMNLFGITNAISKAAHISFQGEERYDMERLSTRVLSEGLESAS